MRQTCVQKLGSKERQTGNIAGTFQSVHARPSVPAESARTAMKPELAWQKEEICVLAALAACPAASVCTIPPAPPSP